MTTSELRVGWRVVKLRADCYHVVPENDTEHHDIEKPCFCKAIEDEYNFGSIVVHNAADGREELE